jgi:hypothetical protein
MWYEKKWTNTRKGISDVSVVVTGRSTCSEALFVGEIKLSLN